MDIGYIDHVGIRVHDEQQSLSFYGKLGFFEHERAHNDPVIIIKNKKGVEINLIVNGQKQLPVPIFSWMYPKNTRVSHTLRYRFQVFSM